MRLKLAYYLSSLAIVLCACLALERRAYAYVDPGSGLFILQAAGTILTGVMYTLRRRIGSLLRLDKSSRVEPDSADGSSGKA